MDRYKDRAFRVAKLLVTASAFVSFAAPGNVQDVSNPLLLKFDGTHCCL
jgi:hypothetical protein